MFLLSFHRPSVEACSPRVCGDVSGAIVQDSLGNQFSPRMRGCFHVHPPLGSSRRVLPAYAGMFPGRSRTETAADGSPRVCGDVSRKNRPLLRSLWFSPRMRGCFWRYGRLVSVLEFSPRMRGCFLAAALHQRARTVLPAYAGMFPKAIKSRLKISSSPRVCGDVSQ